MGRLLGEVAGLPTDSIVLFVSLLRDGAGRPFTDPDAVSLIARASSVPVYSWSETHLGRGIVGGRLASFAAQGARAGELGLRILRGEKPENLPIVDGGGTAYMFDERQLRRWRISESRLPPGSIVRYQEGSLWALYGSYVVGGAVLILIQALLITGLLLQRTGRKRAELSLGERLRFESIVAEVSASLIHVPLSEWDAELERGLQRVAEFLGVDRASLQEYRPDGVIVRISWAVEGVERLSRIVEAGQFPWTTAQLRQRRAIRFSRLDELPEEAVIDRQGYQNVGTRSCLSLPVSDGEIMLGVLSFHSIRNERSWPDEFVERFQLLGEVFAGALGRRAAELLLNERLRFEALLSEQTAVLSSRLPADVDQQIRRGLRQIADFFEVDRGSLTEFSQDRRTARVTHSWVAEGVEPAPPAIGLDELPWVVAKLRDGEVVRFSRVEELPAAEAAVDRATYLRLGIQSRLEVPLMVGGKVVGALAFSTVRAERAWKDELVQRLRLLGEVFANVLSRRQAEVDAQRLRHDLAHVGRVSTIGELTASLAHELTQPLTAILSNAQAALRHLASDPGNLEEMRAILEDIVADDKRAGEVIRRLRGLLKKGDREFVVLDLNETVGEVARLVAADAVLRNVSLALDMTRELPAVWGDRVQLQQVVLNLILNGLDAIRESGRADRSLLIRTSKDGAATVRVAVRDSGVGIDQADLERIFQPFYSTKAEGMGMGLAISRSIVEAHGGRLEAANNPDGGATFSFTLPVSQEEQ
jgi:signal transduction histidine kinase